VTSAPDIARYQELFSGLGRIAARPMMGGTVFYAEGALFATTHGDGRLYLRTKGDLARALKAAGESQLTWTRPSDGKVMAMGYWSLPEDALDDPERACELARQAISEG
jgi:DNA transformation protein